MSYRFDTLVIHAGQRNDSLTGSVVTPIHQTTTFAQTELEGNPEFCYSRTGNPTRRALENNLAALEGARYGLAFASGMAAVDALLHSLSTGDHVVASQDLYGGCYRIFTKIYQRFGVQFSLIDTTDPANVAAAIKPNTKLLWLETPSNPLLRITDIAACSAIAKARGVRVVLDNTFATPLLQRPLQLGVDIVLHSTTKYIGGHCDVLGGALITDNAAIYEELKFLQNACGAVPGPQDCFLLLRGIKTLPLRVQRHIDNASQLAERLSDHPAITCVIFPGLTSHPQHELAARQMKGFGAIVSIELDGGVETVRRFVRRLRLWTLAESLGGVKSLLCHPPTMTHASVDAQERRRIGINDGLIRLSVGIEDPDDLFDDLDQALRGSSSLRVEPSAPIREAVPA